MCTYQRIAAHLLTRVQFVDYMAIGYGNPPQADTYLSDSSPVNNISESVHIVII